MKLRFHKHYIIFSLVLIAIILFAISKTASKESIIIMSDDQQNSLQILDKDLRKSLKPIMKDIEKAYTDLNSKAIKISPDQK